MTEKAKQARAAYMKKWRAANKEKVKKINETYWEKQANKIFEEITTAAKEE
jgi:hypothetical protein